MPDSGTTERLRDLLARFAPLPAGAGWWVDDVGTRTRTGYRRDAAGRDAQVTPVAADDPIEWLALLEAVAGAGDRLTVVELGAGHAPWLARAGVAARVLAPHATLDLVGVEGEPSHAGWMETHLRDNGLRDAATLHHAAVGVTSGVAAFEVAADPAADWGTRVPGTPQPAGMATVIATAGHVEVPCLTLADVLGDRPAVDLLHVDVQGTELELLTAAAPLLSARVRRLCVGTHGRAIEAGLHALLPAWGFRLEADVACVYAQPSDGLLLVRDGAQHWVRREDRA